LYRNSEEEKERQGERGRKREREIYIERDRSCEGASVQRPPVAAAGCEGGLT